MISILEPISINYEITINNVRAITNELYGRNVFKGTEIDKTYIIGYYANLPSSTNNIGIINNILGDDKDWTYQSGGNIVDTAKLSIQGFRGSSSMPYAMVRSVIYWNIVLKGKATIDEINQVIEYFNLDRPGVVVKPDILYDIKRQGITNDNHAEFEDKLKDFIYGFDMQMYNMNWEGTSGINTYPVVFGANKTWYSLTMEKYEYTLNPNIIHLTHINTAIDLQYTYLKNNGVISSINREASAFKLKVTGLNNNIVLVLLAAMCYHKWPSAIMKAVYFAVYFFTALTMIFDAFYFWQTSMHVESVLFKNLNIYAVQGVLSGMTAIQLAGIGFAVAAVLLLFRVTKPQKRKPNFAWSLLCVSVFFPRLHGGYSHADG